MSRRVGVERVSRKAEQSVVVYFWVEGARHRGQTWCVLHDRMCRPTGLRVT